MSGGALGCCHGCFQLVQPSCLLLSHYSETLALESNYWKLLLSGVDLILSGVLKELIRHACNKFMGGSYWTVLVDPSVGLAFFRFA